MNNKSLIFLFTIVFIISNISVESTMIKFHIVGPEIFKKIIYVDDNNTEGPWNGTIDYPYQFINDGLANSSNGDIIFVFSGLYFERIIIENSVKICGENNTNTIIDGSYEKSIIEIYTNNVILKNFTIRNSGGYIDDSGINVKSENNTFQDCIIYRTKTGILLNQTKKNKIENCTFHTNGEGISVKLSNNNKITSCCLGNNAIGINFNNSMENQIEYCYLHSNGIAFLLENSLNIKIYHCNISNNCVNLGGIFIVNCENITLSNNRIIHNGAGVHLFSSNKINISNCDFILNTHFSIILRTPSNNVKVTNCNIKNNLRYGIYIEKSNSCEITKNNIFDNALYGIFSNFINCNARFNWWGSILGPSYFEKKSRSRITIFLGKIRCVPWLLKPLTNIGASWDENEEYMVKNTVDFTKKLIDLPGDDFDNDLVPDWWEDKWGYNSTSWDDHANIDPDNDALNNIEECFTDKWNSSPFIKDIFLEIDWMEMKKLDDTNMPSAELLDEIVNIFKIQEINLHYDIGALGGGEEIPFCNETYSFANIKDMYWKYFLNNNLTNPRKGIFHYGIVCNYCPDLNYPFIGWDDLDSFAISSEWLKKNNPFISKDELIISASVHSLGHSLGLIADTYEGIDNLGTSIILSKQWWNYHNYKSCMNYYYKYKFFDYSDGTNGKGDFNDWGNLDFNFFKNSSFEPYINKNVD
jgi:parallel beta-helix repeat protein